MSPWSGRWTRFGRNGCEGYSLEIGSLLRFSVVKQPVDPEIWKVSLNGYDVGVFDTFERAIDAADKEAKSAMKLAGEHCQTYLAQPPPERRYRGRRR